MGVFQHKAGCLYRNVFDDVWKCLIEVRGLMMWLLSFSLIFKRLGGYVIATARINLQHVSHFSLLGGLLQTPTPAILRSTHGARNLIGYIA